MVNAVGGLSLRWNKDYSGFDILAGVVVMSVPTAFSKLLGD